MCSIMPSVHWPTKVVVWQYNNKRQMLRYRVHCATKVFDARTLHNSSFNAAILAERVIKATRCDWLLATTNAEFARTLHNKRLTDSIFESARRLLSWSGQQHTNVLASLRPAYIRQLLGVSWQIIRRLGVSRLMYARH